jgi:hypothetical protein
MYLSFLIFDLISETPREDEESTIKFVVSVGVLTSVYMVFFARFLKNSRRHETTCSARWA